jgi:23S rRNA pseudouridine2605 synthase
MPLKKSRNSREDKSTNSSKKFGKTERSFSASGSKAGYGENRKPYMGKEQKSDKKFHEERGSGEDRKSSGFKNTGFKHTKGGRSEDFRPGKPGFKGSDSRSSNKTEGSGSYKPRENSDKRDFKATKTPGRLGADSSFKKRGSNDFKNGGDKPIFKRQSSETGYRGKADNFKGAAGKYKNEKVQNNDENDFNFASENKERSFRSGSSEGRPYKKDFKPRTKNQGFESDKEHNLSKADHRADRMNANKSLRSRKPAKSAQDSDFIRLNRYIANAGICSRRKADELIAAGVVSVNGEVVSELGHKVNLKTDIVRYNGEALKREKMVYVLLNKPKDYITTTDDPHERRTVMQLVEKASRERIYPVGRLDRNTTGLLLMTNDGDLAEKLSHPRNNVTKLYHAELNKSMTQGDLNKISYGLELEDGFIKPDVISFVQGGSKREIGIQIHSGKNRIVRRIFEHLGYEVVKLDRVIYGGLTKKDLTRGRWRYLDEKEITQLKHLI